jgi:hypothetical protein
MLKRLLRIWMTFARLIGTVNTYILLFVLFICVLTPTGLVMRLFKKDLFSQPSSNSGWIKRSDKEDLERQF